MLKPTSTIQRRSARIRWRRLWPHRLLAVLLIVVGAVVSVWPVGETFYNNWRAASVVDAYEERIGASGAQVLAAQQQDAARYNSVLAPSALIDPWSDGQEATSAAHDAYLRELAGFGPLGRIRIPEIDVDLPIFHDATRRSLSLGAGHMYGTSLPVGGVGTHAVIAGHTGSTVRTYFDRLNELRVGDAFAIDTAGRTLAYAVDKISVVRADDLSQVMPVPGADLVTLVTCIRGADGKGKRLLVRGTRLSALGSSGLGTATEVPLDSAQAVPSPAAARASQSGTSAPGLQALQAPAQVDFSVLDWMWPRIALSAGAVALLLAMAGRRLWSESRPSAARRVKSSGGRP